MNFRITNRLSPLDAPGFGLLLKESRREGFRFIDRLRLNYEEGTNRFDRPGEALFGAYYEEILVGVCGLNQDPYSSDPTVGRVRRLYVLAAHRKNGLGKLLMEAVIEEARRSYKMLVLNTNTEEASVFYRALGFATESGIPHVTHKFSL